MFTSYTTPFTMACASLTAQTNQVLLHLSINACTHFDQIVRMTFIFHLPDAGNVRPACAEIQRLLECDNDGGCEERREAAKSSAQTMGSCERRSKYFYLVPPQRPHDNDRGDDNRGDYEPG